MAVERFALVCGCKAGCLSAVARPSINRAAPKTSIKTENLSFIAGTPFYGRVYLLSKYRCLSLVLRLRVVFEVTAITAKCERR
jgi:hypothetical protein